MKYDMTQDNPAKSLFFFAVPMVLGNLFQQFYNIVDSIIVGNFVGADALAAVGASTSITFLFVALATGMSVGSSVVISQYFGAGQYGKMKTAISTVVLVMLGASGLLSVVGSVFHQDILRFMGTPENILPDASSYLNIYFFGLVFLFLYNTFTAVFNALGDSKKPLGFLIFSSLLNVGLDLLFVTVFHMGVAGVAYATLIAQGVSCVLSFLVLMRDLKRMELKEEFSWFDLPTLGKIARIAVPSTIQQSIVSFGMIFVQTLVNSFGSTVMAGYTAATKIDNIAIMPMIAVGSAMSTFTAQNIGAGRPERIKKGYHAALIMIAGVALSLTVILFLFGGSFVGAFVDSDSNREVIAVGVNYLRIVSLFYILMGTMNVTNGILRGAGDIRVFMVSTLCNFSFRVILAWTLAPLLNEYAIYYTIPMGWFIGLVIAWLRYRTGKWKEKKLV